MIRSVSLAAALGAIWLWPALAAAAPGDATLLEYARSARAARCPDRDALKNAVSKRLGYDPFFPAARQTIVVEITDADDGLRAQMHLIDENGMIVGSRELKDKIEHCDEVVASLALAISIALDPSAALGEEPTAPMVASDDSREASAPAPEPAAESAPKTQPSVEKPRTKDKQPEHNAGRVTVPSTIRASAFSTLGVAPALAFGARVGVGMRWHWFQLLAEFAVQFPATRTTDSIGSARASLSEGTLAPCFAQGPLAGCALFNLGSLQTEGRDVPYPTKQSSLYAGLGARLELTPRLAGRLHLLLAAEVLKPLTPITLRLHGERVWRTPLFSGSLAIGLSWQFP